MKDSSLEARQTRLHQKVDGGFNPRRKDFSKALGDPSHRTNKSYNVLLESRPWHTRQYHIPSAVGFSTAASIARLLGIVAAGGQHENKILLSATTIQQMTTPTNEKYDIVQLEPTFLTSGGLFYQQLLPESRENRICHHYGYGGSCAYIDLHHQMSFSYVTNTQRFDQPSPRELNILRAVYQCLQGGNSKL